MEVSSVYDQMAAAYLTPGRRSTTALFREVQEVPLQECLRSARDSIGWYSGMNYLVVGPGPDGNAQLLFSLHRCVGPYLDEVRPESITYLDLSSVTISLCREFVEKQIVVMYDRFKGKGAFVKGDAETMESCVALQSYDVVLAALCDHLDPDVFFRSSMQVLKPGGALIVSYPADGINRVVRERIYGIDPKHTRFVIDGKARLVPSRLMTSELLRAQYAAHGFERIQTTNVLSGRCQISETIHNAANIIGVDATTVPLVTVGIGFKNG